MSGERQNLILAFVAGQFKRAAIVLHFGYEDEAGRTRVDGDALNPRQSNQ
jgi:hypothetical protein